MKRGLISTISGAVINFLLSLLKLFIGIVSNSITIFFDAMNNMFDVLGSGFGAVGYGVSRKKSKRFPNGYNRLDALISFIILVSTIIFGGVFIFYSVERLLFPLPVYFSWLYFSLLVVTVFVKIAMGTIYYYSYKAEPCDTIKSLYIDSFMDAVITGSIVICYSIGQSTDTVIDAVLGIVLGILMIIIAIREIINVTTKLIDYNSHIDVEGVSKALVGSNVMRSVASITMISDNRLVVAGEEYMLDRDKISDIEERYQVKICFLKEIEKDEECE